MHVIFDHCFIHSDLSDSFLERSIRLVLPLKWVHSLARRGSFLRELGARLPGRAWGSGAPGGREKLGGGRVQEKLGLLVSYQLALRELKFLLSSRWAVQ